MPSRNCVKDIKDEFSREKFDYDDCNRGKWIHLFGSSNNRCLKNSKAFQGLRLFLAFLTLAITVTSMVYYGVNDMIDCWFIYLGHWGLLAELVYFGCAWFSCKQADAMESGAKLLVERMPKYVVATWVLQDILLPGALLSFLLFWFLILPVKGTGILWVGDFCVHGIAFILMIIDKVVSGQPYYLSHSIYIFFFGLFFVGWTAIYYALGGTDCQGHNYIYKALDWSNFDKTVCLAGSILFLVIPIWNFLFWFLISQCFPAYREQEQPMEKPQPKLPEDTMKNPQRIGVC